MINLTSPRPIGVATHDRPCIRRQRCRPWPIAAARRSWKRSQPGSNRNGRRCLPETVCLVLLCGPVATTADMLGGLHFTSSASCILTPKRSDVHYFGRGAHEPPPNGAAIVTTAKSSRAARLRFQLLGALLTGAGEGIDAYLPVSVDRLQLYDRPSGAAWCAACVAKRRATWCWATANSSRLRLGGSTARRRSAAALPRDWLTVASRPAPSRCYELEWLSEPLDSPSRMEHRSSRALVDFRLPRRVGIGLVRAAGGERPHGDARAAGGDADARQPQCAIPVDRRGGTSWHCVSVRRRRWARAGRSPTSTPPVNTAGETRSISSVFVVGIEWRGAATFLLVTRGALEITIADNSTT